MIPSEAAWGISCFEGVVHVRQIRLEMQQVPRSQWLEPLHLQRMPKEICRREEAFGMFSLRAYESMGVLEVQGMPGIGQLTIR